MGIPDVHSQSLNRYPLSTHQKTLLCRKLIQGLKKKFCHESEDVANSSDIALVIVE